MYCRRSGARPRCARAGATGPASTAPDHRCGLRPPRLRCMPSCLPAACLPACFRVAIACSSV
eukprot:1985650-Prymnesium_polylepis.1